MTVPIREQCLFYNGNEVVDQEGLTLEGVGIGEDDMLLLRRRSPVKINPPQEHSHVSSP